MPQLTRTSNLATTQSTKPPQQRPSDSRPGLIRANTLIDSLVRLGKAYSQPLDEDVMEMYLLALSDLSPEQLTNGFTRAVRESKFWPRPSELREYCTGLAAKGTDTQEANRHWAWCVRWAPTLVEPREYSVTSPPPATVTWEEYGYKDNGYSPWSQRGNRPGEARYYEDQKEQLAAYKPTERFESYGLPGPRRFPLYNSTLKGGDGLVTVTVAIPPPIPEVLQEILTQVEGSVSRALDRIVAHLDSGDDRHLRHNFEEAALSVIASRKTETYTSAARQLTGEVVVDMVERSGLFEVRDKKLAPLSEERARQMRAEGTISDSVLDAHLWTMANLDFFSRSEYKPRKRKDDDDDYNPLNIATKPVSYLLAGYKPTKSRDE